MKKKVLSLSFVASLCFISYKAITYSGAPPNSHTNAPGESNCTACHSGTLNSGTALNNLTLTTSTALSSLQPNTTYTFDLTFNQTGRVRYGFQLCVLPPSATATSASIGTLTSTSTQTTTSTTTNPARTYLMHNSTGTSAPSAAKTWQFSYTTPSVVTSAPVFYVALNASNNDFASSGDLIYAKTFTSTILPVKWGDVSIETEQQHLKIVWSTYTEINNERFEVEKSTDGYNWIVAGTVKGSGNSRVHKTYRFNEEASQQDIFYRIKQVDLNGNYSYSDIVGRSYETVETIEPLYNFTAKALLLPDFPFGDIRITDMKGHSAAMRTEPVNNLLQVDVHMLKPGVYVLSAELHGSTRYWKVMVY